MPKKLTTVSALACALLLTVAATGPGGCSFLQKATSNEAGVLQGQKIDEQALALLYAGGTAANLAATVAAKSGALSPAQAVKVKAARAKLDEALHAAQTAYEAGDATTFNARVAAGRSLIEQINVLVKPAA